MKLKNYLKALFVLAAVFMAQHARSADYYWVGGEGNWEQLTHWSPTSGGSATYSQVPSPTDNVIFDHNSGFTPGNQTVKTNSNIYCNSMTWVNAPNNPIFEKHQQFDFLLFGSLTLQPGMTFNGRIYFAGNSPAVLTTNGTAITGAIEIAKENTSITFADDLILRADTRYNTSALFASTALAGTISFYSGTIEMTGKKVYANLFYSDNSNIRHINMDDATFYFKHPLCLDTYSTNIPYAPNTTTYIAFTYQGNNNTVSAARSIIRQEKGFGLFRISSNNQLTFNNFIVQQSSTSNSSSYYSYLTNCIVNKLIVYDGYQYVNASRSSTAFINQIDTIIFNPNNNTHSGAPNVITGSYLTNKYFYSNGRYGNNSSGYESNTTIGVDYGTFDKIIANSNIEDIFTLSGRYNTINSIITQYKLTLSGSNNTVNSIYTYNDLGTISGNNNKISMMTFENNGNITGTNNEFDTLVFTAGYSYRFGTGVTNKVLNKWYASGNPCYLTDVLNISPAGTATLSVSGSQVDLDYIRIRGLIATGPASPFNIRRHGLDLGSNTNINFAPYDPNSVLEGLGPDTAICSSDFPYTLQTDGFVASPSTFFEWFDGTSTLTKDVDSAGKYWLSVDYGRGCFLTDTIEIKDRFKISYTNSKPICNTTTPQGGVTAVATGISATYTYTWNTTPPQNTATLSDVPAGRYELTVTDDSGCTVIDTVTIAAPSSGQSFEVSIPAGQVFPDCSSSGSTGGSGAAVATAQGGNSPYTYLWNDPSITRDSSVYNLVPGTYQVIATDALGCKDTAEVIIDDQQGAIEADLTVVQPQNCEITGNVTVNVTSGLPPYNYTWSDNSSLNNSINPAAKAGNQQVIVIDANNCIKNLPYTITPPDVTPPVIENCPSDTVFSNTPGQCNGIAIWTPPTATDNCTIKSFTSNYTPGMTFPIGTTTITYKAEDIAGNISTCSFNITIKDTEKPVFQNCPSDVVVTVTNGNCAATASWDRIRATDNCGLVSVIGDFPSGSVFQIGTTIVTYVATDSHGNTDTCRFNVIVKNTLNQFYISSCPSGPYNYYTSNSHNDSCSVSVSLRSMSVVNNCGNYTYTADSDIPGTSIWKSVGTHTITYKVTNGADTATCSYDIVAIDNSSPRLVSSQEINNYYNYYDADTCVGRFVTWNAPVFKDNCGIDTVESTHQSGDLFPIGQTTVRYTVRDINGNSNSYSFYVVVRDISPSVSGCPGNRNVILATNECDRVQTWTEPVFNYNCAIDSLVKSHNTGDVFGPGNHTVSYVAYYANGRTASCSFTIRVTESAPAVTVTDCPPYSSQHGARWYTQQVDTANYCGESISSWSVPVFTAGPCSNPIANIEYTGTVQHGDLVPEGTYPILYIAKDASGNELARCEFTYELIDRLSKVTATNCPNTIISQDIDQTIFCDRAIVSFTPPSFASLGCAPVIDTIISNINPGDTLYAGDYTVIYKAYDTGMNELARCSFTLRINSTNGGVVVSCPPTIDSPVYGSDAFLINADPFTCEGIANWPEPEFTPGFCNGTIDRIDNNIAVGEVLPVGRHYIYYRAYDSGNRLMASCSFYAIVTANDSTGFFQMPADTTVYASAGNCLSTLNWPLPVYSGAHCHSSNAQAWVNSYSQSWHDNFLDPYNNNGNQAFPVGTYSINYELYDGVSQYTNTYTIHVIDSTIPSFGNTCPTDTIELYTAFNTCEAVAVWDVPVATINGCNSNTTVLLSSNYHTNDLVPIGLTEVIYTATSSGSVQNTCKFYVRVTDNQAPVFTVCPDNVTASTSKTSCDANVTWIAPKVFDNCPNYTLTSTHANGSLFPLGVTAVTYTVTDQSGNTATCSFNVTVIDNVAPQIVNCPADITAIADAETCKTVVSWDAPTTSDNCSDTGVLSVNIPSGSEFNLGYTQIIYTVTDQNGYSSSCYFTVHVTDPSGNCGGGGTIIPLPDVEVPEAFTPDGDGKNDYFVIKNIEAYPNNELVVFNRWGNEVYKAAGYNNEWDGTAQANDLNMSHSKLPSGTYYYVLDTNDPVQKVKKGFVYLQR